MNHHVDEKLKLNLHKKLKSTFSKTVDNPVIRANDVWQTLREQLEVILDAQVYNQWFKPIKPIVLNNNILLLQTENQFAERWINTHYQELVELLLTGQDKKLSCFFIAPRKA